jgi:hypothetical protein
LAQPQLQKWARCSTAVFPKILTFREKLSQVSPVPKDYSVTPPPPRKASPPPAVTVYIKNSLEVEGVCVSPSESPPTWRYLYVCLVFCCLFQHFPLPPVRCLGQASAAHKTIHFVLHVGYFQDRVSQTISPGWLQTVILLISASQVGRITGVSHWHPAHLLQFLRDFSLHSSKA